MPVFIFVIRNYNSKNTWGIVFIRNEFVDGGYTIVLQ